MPVQFSASPVKGFGHGITNPDPARREEFEEEISDRGPGRQKAGRQEDLRRGRRRDQGLFARRADPGRDRRAQGRRRIVEPEGITIILEPLNILVDHPRQLVVHSEHAARILKAVGSPNVKMLFDIYHQQISEGNLTGNIRKYHDLIGYYQLADHPGRHEPTTGEINYAFVLRTIHDTGYRGAIGMEMSPKSDPMAAFKAIRRSMRWRKSVRGVNGDSRCDLTSGAIDRCRLLLSRIDRHGMAIDRADRSFSRDRSMQDIAPGWSGSKDHAGLLLCLGAWCVCSSMQEPRLLVRRGIVMG